MKLIAAPARQFKTWSLIITAFLGTSGAIVALVQTFSELNIISSTVGAALVAVIATLAVIAKFIVQNVPVTENEKIAIVSAAAAQPMKPGEDNVTVRIDSKKAVPSTPKGVKDEKS